ncbi:MAG: imidazolonepropionase [Ignavibacteriae bacterium]|nr:imidazolonepropionase [Ignavibacteriota bacterium]
MKLALINIKQLVTVASQGKRMKVGAEMRDLGIIENGAVMIENETITWVGRMEDLSMGDLNETDVVDCTNYVVIPGFVDSHTHLVFAGSREDEFAMRSAGATYQEIAERGGGILNTVRRVRAASKKELKKFARKYIHNMLKQGTTVVEIKSGYGLDMDNEIKMLEAIAELGREEVMTIVSTFLGAHAIPPEFKENKSDYIRLITNKMIPYIAQRNLAEFCDVFCEQGYFDLQETETILSSAKQAGLALKLHAEELSPLGGSELAARLNTFSVDHLEHITENGIKALAESQTVATLLPGVSFFLNHQYAPARAMIDAGVPVAIATDFNPGSCMSYSMPLMMTIACTHMKMTPEETITATTLNAAAALNRSHEYGSIEVGKKADVVIFDIPNYKFLPYHFGENHVYRTIKHGVLLEF